MKAIKVCLVGTGLCVALTATAGQVAYVDYATLMQKAPQVKASEAALKKEFAPRLRAMKKKAAKLHELALKLSDMGPGTNSLKRAAALENYRKAQQDLRQERQSYETTLQLRRSQLSNNFSQLVSDDIKAYAKSHGIDVVVKSGGIYEAPGVDLTSRILKQLEQDYSQAKAQAENQKKQ